LARLELAQYFHDRVFIMTRKDAQTLQGILDVRNLDPDATWMVGNSPRFDINPALVAGLNCIWVHTSFWKQELEDIGADQVFGAFSLDEVANVLLYGNGFGTQVYVPPADKVQELQSALLEFPESENAWVVGSSPKFDINPALSVGAKPIWIPRAFDTDDVEPFYGRMFVAFSSNGARQIIKRWSSGNLARSKVVWRLREKKGDLGGSLIVD
jgi:hypothetical protein